MKIYVASSWRNTYQPFVVEFLRALGHEVYDFRHPKKDDHGFSWGDIAETWQGWKLHEYREALRHPIAEAGFKSDMDALRWCDLCVVVMPCGRSAHLEAGWAAGAGKKVIMLIPERAEPELMVKMFSGGIVLNMAELGQAVGGYKWDQTP